MSRTARTALAATVLFAVSGALSGLLIDEYGGAAGALEWGLRTLVVISAAVALGAAFVLVLRLRHRVRPAARLGADRRRRRGVRVLRRPVGGVRRLPHASPDAARRP